jgi:flagellar hook-associated protein 1 FlgK
VINNYTSQIADLNGKIQAQEALKGTTANELRDQQEQLVKDLSEFLDVKVAYDDNNLMTLKLAAGQPLVLQDRANSLSLVGGNSDPQQLNIMLDFGKYSVGVSSQDVGGSLGGLISYRDEFATSAQRMLGQQAWALADNLNEQNRLGLDGDGKFGAALFSVGEIAVAVADRNSDANTSIDVRFADGGSKDVSTNDYEVIMNSPTSFTVRTLDSNGKLLSESALVDTTTAIPNANGYFTVAGFGVEIKLNAGGSYATGDTYEFAPTQDVARQLNMVATSGSALALAAPIEVSASSSNLSDAKISISAITDTDIASSDFVATPGLAPTAPHSLRFTAADTYDVLDSSGNVLGTQTVTSYDNLLQAAGITSAGYDVSLDSAPQAGDTFSIAFNSNGSSDNYNGVRLAGIQNQSVVGGDMTLGNAYTSLVTEVGSLTATLKTNMDATQVVMNQSVSTRDQISAVSLDEEAVNLLRFQQSYSAAAQVISAARETFSTLLSVLR